MQHRSELQVTSGVVPCASGNIKTTVNNKGKKRLQLRKHAVVAEVHPFSTEFIKEDEVKKTSILIQAEIQTKPNSPPIPGEWNESLEMKRIVLRLWSFIYF